MSVISFLHPIEAKPFLEYLGLKALQRPQIAGFKARSNAANGTPKPAPAIMRRSAISIEVFYIGIRGNIFRQAWRRV
jgi:hypothetical protein